MEESTTPPLNLPAYNFRTRERDGKLYLLDTVRKRYVRATDEEWVRQHFVRFLIQERGVPRALIAIEKEFTYQGLRKRADAVVYDSRGNALMMIECKAPGVSLAQATFDQIARYNRHLHARYLVVTNGLVHYCYTAAGGDYHFLDDIPHYRDMTSDNL